MGSLWEGRWRSPKEDARDPRDWEKGVRSFRDRHEHLNLIEEAFAKIKGLLRRAVARTREALIEAMGGALHAVTASDALGFFDHHGTVLQLICCDRSSKWLKLNS